MESLDQLMLMRTPTARRPLLGLTVLVVEDSRFACEAMRLLCLRSGARLRRADSLCNARRHLQVYRPTVLIVDVGLPDGSGLSLIAALSAATPRIDVIMGTSGDTSLERQVMAAGADGFLAKPLAGLSGFQSAILSLLPPDRQPPGPRLLSNEQVEPDMIAYHDDLSHVAQVLAGDTDQPDLDYVTQFLEGVARSAKDSDLCRAVDSLVRRRRTGADASAQIAALTQLVRLRLASGGSALKAQLA